MLSPQERERKKGMFAKRTNENLKKYTELYADFDEFGYSRSLAKEFAEYFVENSKKPTVGDIVQAARLYDKIRDYKTGSVYIDKLEEYKKFSSDEKYYYCIEALTNKSKIGNWRDAEDFRTEHIDFLQKYSEKLEMSQKADLYIALAFSDCAAKQYNSAFRLLTGFGYKPCGKNDVKLLEILTAGVYICSKTGDEASIMNAMNNAFGALELIKDFEHSWSKSYFEAQIRDAADGII